MMGSNEKLEKLPPQNLEAERSVLGAMLLEKRTISKVMQALPDSDSFYSETHRLIYKEIIGLSSKNKPVDIVTLKEEFRKKNKLKDIGGAVYLADLVNSVPTTANVDYYAQIVREKYILRDLLRAVASITSLSYDSSQDLDNILDKAQSFIFDITRKRIKTPVVHIKEVLTDTFEHIEALYEKKEHITGIPTGFDQFDRLTSGFQPSDLIIIAGRPSMGKTSLALNIAQYASIEARVPLVIFSMESAKEQLVEHLLCSEARVNGQELRVGHLSEEDWTKLTDAAGILADAPIYIDDTPGMGVLELRMAIVDYLQLMAGDRRSESRQQEISEISRSLKALAKELGIAVVAISQLSRAVEKRGEEDKRPRLSDLRESGAIEQDADLVVSLYREHYYSRKPEDEGIAELIINKQRRGPIGKIDLTFLSEYARFESRSFRDIK